MQHHTNLQMLPWLPWAHATCLMMTKLSTALGWTSLHDASLPMTCSCAGSSSVCCPRTAATISKIDSAQAHSMLLLLLLHMLSSNANCRVHSTDCVTHAAHTVCALAKHHTNHHRLCYTCITQSTQPTTNFHDTLQSQEEHEHHAARDTRDSVCSAHSTTHLASCVHAILYQPCLHPTITRHFNTTLPP